MAIMLSGREFFVNNFLRFFAQGNTIEPILRKKDREGLLTVIRGLDRLHSSLDIKSGRPFVTPHSFTGLTTSVDQTRNVEASEELYEAAHKIISPYWISVETYRNLGKAFDEIGATPSEDLAQAIHYGTAVGELDRKLKTASLMNWARLKRRRYAYSGFWGTKIGFPMEDNL